MGNRACVVFVTPDQISPAVYLHWNGGADSVYLFLDELDRRYVRTDADYECARFIQIAGEFLNHPHYEGQLGHPCDSLSLGVVNGPKAIDAEALGDLSCMGEDQGVFVVQRHDRISGPKRTVRRFRPYKGGEMPKKDVLQEESTVYMEKGRVEAFLEIFKKITGKARFAKG